MPGYPKGISASLKECFLDARGFIGSSWNSEIFELRIDINWTDAERNDLEIGTVNKLASLTLVRALILSVAGNISFGRGVTIPHTVKAVALYNLCITDQHGLVCSSRCLLCYNLKAKKISFDGFLLVLAVDDNDWLIDEIHTRSNCDIRVQPASDQNDGQAEFRLNLQTLTSDTKLQVDDMLVSLVVKRGIAHLGQNVSLTGNGIRKELANLTFGPEVTEIVLSDVPVRNREAMLVIPARCSSLRIIYTNSVECGITHIHFEGELTHCELRGLMALEQVSGPGVPPDLAELVSAGNGSSPQSADFPNFTYTSGVDAQ